MKVNRQGITRLVFVFDSFVVKVPNFTCQFRHFLTGFNCNRSESGQWKRACKIKKELLAPVMFCSWFGIFLVMKKAEVFDWGTGYGQIDYTIWDDAGYGGDHKPQNYGLYEGRMVKIDYAV